MFITKHDKIKMDLHARTPLDIAIIDSRVDRRKLENQH